MPYSIQVHHKYPEASSEAGVPYVLSGSDWQFEAIHWPETLNKDPHQVFNFIRGLISNMNIFIFVHTANSIFHKLKRQFGVFSESQIQWSASNSLSEPENTSETPASEDALGYLWLKDTVGH